MFFVYKTYLQLTNFFVDREKDASSCQEQLDEFRKLIRIFQKWLKETEGSIPHSETFLSTKELEKQIEHLKVGTEKAPLEYDSQ